MSVTFTFGIFLKDFSTLSFDVLSKIIKRGKKVNVQGYKKAIITLKKGQSIDLTTGI